MTISYEQAMQTLQTMFASADPEVITMVLQANNGHMERTVEQLLAMTSPSTQGPAPGMASPNSEFLPSGGGVQLPDDFLRPPSYFQQKYGRHQRSQVEQDAILAQLLQDEMFLRELGENPEAFGMRRRGRRQAPPQGQAARPNAAPASATASALPARPPAAAPASAAAPAPAVAPKPGAAPAAGQAQAAPAEAKSSEGSAGEKWGSLTAAARRKFAALLNRMGQSRDRRTKQQQAGEYMELPNFEDKSGGHAHFELVDDADVELEDKPLSRQKSSGAESAASDESSSAENRRL